MVQRVRDFVTGRGLVFVPWLLMAGSDLFAQALADREPSFRSAVSVGLWASWAALLVVLVLPGAAALTLARVGVPASIPASLWALLSIEGDVDAIAAAGAVLAALATGTVLLPHVGERFVDAASYGDESRHLLRPPGPVLVALILPTWVVTVAGATVGPLMLADERWGIGLVATVVGLPLAIAGLRALHRLARRWLVFVPAGVVLHDHVALSQAVLVPRASIRSLGPAPAETSALDLTTQAFGLALEIRLGEPITLALSTARGRAEEKRADAVMIAPSRPAVLMREAARRRIPIG